MKKLFLIFAGLLLLSGCGKQIGDSEVIVIEEKAAMTFEEALDIAELSECTDQGRLTEQYMYNEFTDTWWFDLDIDREGCNPACVVDEITRTASINWRCTGVIPE